VHLNQLNLAGPGTFATRIERGAGAQTYVAFDVHNSAGTANVAYSDGGGSGVHALSSSVHWAVACHPCRTLTGTR